MHQSFTIFLKEVNRFKRSQVTEVKIWDETETNTVHETARFNKIKFHFGKDDLGTYGKTSET